MIVYDLECRDGPHRFEGWFKSSGDFTQQQERGLVTCPACGSADVGKALQAPRLARKGNQLPQAPSGGRPALEPGFAARGVEHDAAAATPPLPAAVPAPVANASLPPQAVELIRKLAEVQAEALRNSRYVGQNFAEDARAIHYGEREAETIHGQATLAEANELIEEGIAVMPLPFPVAPPETAN